MSSIGNGAITLSVVDFYKRGKRGFLCFSFTHAVKMILQREKIWGDVLLSSDRCLLIRSGDGLYSWL